MTDKQIRELAEKHWDFVGKLLDQQRLIEKKLFIDAFIHGYKHGESKKRGDGHGTERS